MGSHKKKNVEIDVSKGYEKNEIQVRGIVITTVFLFLTCFAAFFLMWLLQSEAEKFIVDKEKQNANPLVLTKEAKLPPEPRLQSAPGFGIDGPNGRINLELKHPQAEWEELKKIWDKEAKEGQKVVQNGVETAVTLPIAEAKKRLLAENISTVSAEQGKENLKKVNSYFSDASSGRQTSSRKW